jgi:hypothetical protein
MKPKYAKGTTVSVDQSKAEIKRLLKKYGADAFGEMEDASGGSIVCRIAGRNLKFHISNPPDNLDRFKFTPTGKRRTEAARKTALEAEIRQKWRILKITIQAKMEAVIAEISDIESEFMANILLPDGRTVAETMNPQIDNAYNGGILPRLPSFGGNEK